MYKSKAKKVQSINEADEIGNPLGKRNNWYKYSKAQDISQ